MYRILYNESTIFDPYGNENEVVTDASMSVEINAAAYLDFTMSRLHPLYNTIAERDGVVTLYWDQKILFQGVIESIDMDIQGNKSISCVSALDYLNDTVVRPYSTIAGEQELTAPSSVDGYFQWLIDQHNDHVLDAGKLFEVGVNQGANLQQNNFIYRSSTSNPTTASEITDQLLDSLGGYLTMRYVEDRRVLDLYSDIHTMNAQVIDFGVNITDFSKTIDTKDQYTALLLKGGSPEFLGGDFEDGSFDYWVSHPNTPITTGTVHGGTYSSFFTEGNGEYINSSFFYAKKGARYKSTVWIKNERSSTIKVYPRYQVYEAGDWVGKTIDGSYDVPNDGEWHEYSFDFMPNLEDYVRIRPRWAFDTVGNDGNKRVYVDDFDFRRVEGGTDVAEDPISVSMVPDGGMQYDANILKTGDVIYDPTAVARYGYKEKVYEDSTITDVDDLLQAGVKALNKLKDPQIGLDIKAVDLALFMDGYDHLNVGDAVRVRSAIHDTDEFLMVTSITLDLQDPGQSEYNIGKAYDSLTGQQSGFLRSLNSGINSSLDAVASLDQTTKDQAIQLGNVENVANQAQNTANNAQNTANEAQNTANANKEAIDSIKDAQTEYEKQLEQMQQGVADATEEIGQVNERIEGMNSEIESAKSDIDSLRSSTETELQNVKQSVSKVQSDVDAVTQKASDLASDLDSTKATVEQVTTDLGEVKTTVSNAATKADQALQVSTSASQTATEAKTTATSAYQDAQSALTQSSTASQTANAVKTELETKYSTTDEIAEQYATKSLVEQTSQSITSTVEATYATKATVEALENIANNAVQTWMGSGVPTLGNKPASDWTTNELKSQHSGDIYYDSDTGHSYRFGSSDGKNYSWSLIKDTDISKAVADAAKAQQTAEGVSDEVTQLKTDIPATYATKTEVKQTTDSIKSTVSEVASTANSALSKATTVEQTAKGLQTTVTEQAEKLDGAVTTISQVSQKVDSVSSTITQVQGDLKAVGASVELINPDFETGNTTGWEITKSKGGDPAYVNNVNPYTGTYKLVIPSMPAAGNLSIMNDAVISVKPGDKYRVTVAIFPDATITAGGNVNVGFHYNDGTNSGFAQTVNGGGWTLLSDLVTIPSDKKTAQFRIGLNVASGNNVRVDSVKIENVTDARTAIDTANSALSQSSTVKQELTSFKTSVQQTYETKNDALSKQSSLQQSVNNLRTEVSEQYTTKTTFEALNDAATKTYQFHDHNVNSTGWYKLGTWSGTAQMDIAVITIYAGNGQNGQTHQNRELQVYIKDGFQTTAGATRAFGVTIDRIRNADAAEVQVRATSSNSCEVWYKGDTAYSGGRYTVSIDPDTTWTHSGVYRTSAPTSGTLQTQEYQTYSTRSYVDQTSRTVSLGVVEEYKNGQHGSALATQSDITATKNSITQTVSQTYLSKTDATNTYLNKNTAASTYATKTEVKQTSDSLTVTINEALDVANSAASSIQIKNSSFETGDLTGWATEGFSNARVTSGNAVGAYRFEGNLTASSGGFAYLRQNGTIGLVPGHTYRLTATRAYLDVEQQLILCVRRLSDNSRLTPYDASFGGDGAWRSIGGKFTVPSSYASDETYRVEVIVNRNSTNRFLIDDISITDVTDANSAQSTANKANSNAQNAQNRVGNLETCIKMTSDGVRVGKISNGNFVGVSALVNSAGSFDVLDSSGNVVSRFATSSIELGKSSKISTVSMCGGVVKFSSNSEGTSLAIDTQDQGPIAINDRELGMFGRACQFGSGSYFRTTAKNQWVKATMTPQYINSDGVTATNIKPFASYNGGVTFNVTGLYLISISAYASDVAHLDICHLGLMNSAGTIQMEQQVCAGGNWDGITHTECRRVTAGTTLWMAYKCENAAGSSMVRPFMTCAFLSYVN